MADQPDTASTNIEYERRFLVPDGDWLDGHNFDMIYQVYLFVRAGWCVRIRRTTYRPSEGPPYRVGPLECHVKGPRRNQQRREVPLNLPEGVGLELFRRAEWKVVKSRYQVVDAGTTWDVDRFWLANEPLIIAECEMQDPNELRSQPPPDWCGDEVTDDPRYNNEELALNPYSLWPYIY
jgi:adenylate cyclase